MQKMSRMQRVNYIMTSLYEICKDFTDEKLVEAFYDFLVKGSKEDTEIIAKLSQYCEMAYEDINVHRDDLVLEIIRVFYMFMKNHQSRNEITEAEENLVTYFESKDFVPFDLVEYFVAEENETVVRDMIEKYFLFTTCHPDLIKTVVQYNGQNETKFLRNLCRSLNYADTCDVIARIYDELVEELADEDDYESEAEYEEACQEFYEECGEKVVVEVMEFLTSKFSKGTDFRSFIQYYVSLVYAILLIRMKEQALTDWDEEAILVIEDKNATAESIMGFFQNNKNFFMGIELVSQEYLDTKGTLFDIRYQFDSKRDNEIFLMLDSEYVCEKPEFDYSNILYVNSIIDTMEIILTHFQQKYPKDYMTKLYECLLTSTSKDDGILYEHDISDKFMIPVKIYMMRLLARKFFVYNCSRDVGDLAMEELYLFNALMFADKSDVNIVRLFQEGGYEFLEIYFHLAEYTENLEKHLIRLVDEKQKLPIVHQIDSFCILDETFVKALSEGTLYTILEENGVENTLRYLQTIAEHNPEECEDNLGELLTEIYSILSRQTELDENEKAIYRYIEYNQWTVKDYKNDLFMNEGFLTVLLNKYLAKPKMETFYFHGEETEQYQKVKQKLNWHGKKDNPIE